MVRSRVGHRLRAAFHEGDHVPKVRLHGSSVYPHHQRVPVSIEPHSYPDGWRRIGRYLDPPPNPRSGVAAHCYPSTLVNTRRFPTPRLRTDAPAAVRATGRTRDFPNIRLPVLNSVTTTARTRSSTSTTSTARRRRGPASACFPRCRLSGWRFRSDQWQLRGQFGTLTPRTVFPRGAMPTLDSLLGRVLADARRRAGLSQEALASRAKLHPTYISQLERGLKSPTVRVLFVLADACSTPASEILRQVEELAD